MRHRKRGRHLGRSPSHRRALLRNLASALFLTERETDADLDKNIPKVKGRITTTLHKAKEVRPLVEKCITIAVDSLAHEAEAEQYATSARRNTEAWKEWRQSERYTQWNQAIAPTVAARRRVVRMIGDKQAVRVLFADIAPRFKQRAGGYTRILKLSKPRLGDAGARAILEFVGERDRVRERAQKPKFETGESPAPAAAEAAPNE
jgi:large subunit ribosomal protein L17